jgi:hypothetical protein
LGLFAGPLFADANLLRPSEVRRVDYRLDQSTGTLTRVAAPSLRAAVCWDSTRASGYFSSFAADQIPLDWGDADNATCLAAVTGFQIGYAATTLPGDQTDIDLVFYAADNGFGDGRRRVAATLRLTGLPDGTTPLLYMGWIASFTVTPPIDLSSPDFDDDGLGDFSYTYNMRNVPADGLAGPLLSADPNTALSIGAENAFDLFTHDPNAIIEPNEFLFADVNTVYDGTFWFNSPPYAQWHFQLSAGDPNAPGCDHPSCAAADIEPPGGDCDVDLADLATLLANFGATGGATREQGDLEGADGDVDLSDLALLLSAYGADCRPPGLSCVYTVTNIQHYGTGASDLPDWIELGATGVGRRPCGDGAPCPPEIVQLYRAFSQNRTCVTFSDPVCMETTIGRLCPNGNVDACP